MMITSQYERLNVHVDMSDIAVLRKARKQMLNDYGRSPVMRTARKEWYRALLEEHHYDRHLYQGVIIGGW